MKYNNITKTAKVLIQLLVVVTLALSSLTLCGWLDITADSQSKLGYLLGSFSVAAVAVYMYRNETIGHGNDN